MASLPPLPGPAVQGVPNLSKGAFMQGFINTLTQHLNQLLSENRARSDRQQREQQSVYEALLKSGDPELAALGFTGLLDEKGGKTDFLGRLKKSPIYEQARQVIGQIHGAQENPESLLQGLTGQGGPPSSAAMPTSSIPQGTAAGGADQGAGLSQQIPLGASQAGVTMPAMSEPPAAAVPPSVTAQGPAPAPTAPAQANAPIADYASFLQVISNPKYRLDPQMQKLGQLMRSQQMLGIPFEEAKQAAIDEMIPSRAALRRTKETQARIAGRQEVEVPAEEAKRLGMVVPEGITSLKVDARVLAQAGATQRKGMGGGKRLQLKGHQPSPGGPTYLHAFNPETQAWEQQYTAEGTPMLDSPEYRKMLSSDEKGNIQETFVVPGGSGGGASSGGGAGVLSAPPKPGERRAPTFPKEQQLADDFRKEIAPYNKQGDSVSKILALKGDESGAAQMATIFSFIQNLDQSVVRPSEVATIQEAQALTDRWQTSIKRGLGGSDIIVSPELIDRLRSIAERQYASTAERQAQTYTNMLEKADKEKLDAKFIIGGSIHPALLHTLTTKAQSGQLSPAEENLLKLMAKLGIQ